MRCRKLDIRNVVSKEWSLCLPHPLRKAKDSVLPNQLRRWRSRNKGYIMIPLRSVEMIWRGRARVDGISRAWCSNSPLQEFPLWSLPLLSALYSASQLVHLIQDILYTHLLGILISTDMQGRIPSSQKGVALRQKFYLALLNVCKKSEQFKMKNSVG